MYGNKRLEEYEPRKKILLLIVLKQISSWRSNVKKRNRIIFFKCRHRLLLLLLGMLAERTNLTSSSPSTANASSAAELIKVTLVWLLTG